jgi:hypothetical protein
MVDWLLAETRAPLSAIRPPTCAYLGAGAGFEPVTSGLWGQVGFRLSLSRDAFCTGEMHRQELSGSVQHRGRFVKDRVIGLEEVGDRVEGLLLLGAHGGSPFRLGWFVVVSGVFMDTIVKLRAGNRILKFLSPGPECRPQSWARATRDAAGVAAT